MRLQDVQWGSRLPPLSRKGCTGRDSDSESAIMHFLRVSFILSVLPTVFLKRLPFPSARLCRNWLPGSLSPGRDCTPQHSASFCGAVCRSQQPLVSALLFSAVSGGGKCFYFRPVEGKRDFPPSEAYLCVSPQVSSSHPAWCRRHCSYLRWLSRIKRLYFW